MGETIHLQHTGPTPPVAGLLVSCGAQIATINIGCWEVVYETGRDGRRLSQRLSHWWAAGGSLGRTQVESEAESLVDGSLGRSASSVLACYCMVACQRLQVAGQHGH